jgi:hypothetical protein
MQRGKFLVRPFKLFAAACFVLILAAHGSAAAQAGKGSARARQESAARRGEEVRSLVEATGVIERELEQMEPLLARMRQRAPQIPDKVWQEVREEFKKTFTREAIIEIYAPIYSRHFRPAEIRQLLAFFRSPVGKKLVADTKMMEAEAILGGMERGINLGEKIRQLLKARGYETPVT